MTYEEIVSKIENMRRFGKKTGLEISTELLKYLDYPEKAFETIHIAGTNGKGSTAMYIASIISTERKVGLFTSPHLISFRERIRIGEDCEFTRIKRDDVVRLGEVVLSVCDEHGIEPTMFDVALAMALLYYKEQGCDYVVLETGLGGTYDSTRAVSVVPTVSVITNIGFDHEAVLGNTLTEIAFNKAGILRPGTKAVIAKMEKEAEKVIVDACTSQNIEFSFSEETGNASLAPLIAALPPYQIENARNAVTAIRFIEEDFDIMKGLKKAKWPGRMQVVSRNPFLLLDGAHNPQGVLALKESLMALYPDEKFTFVVGVLADKDYASMMKTMVSIAERFCTVTVDSDRALQGKELAEAICSYGVTAEEYDKIEDAISGAKNYAEKIVVFGSLYFIGEVMAWLKENKN